MDFAKQMCYTLNYRRNSVLDRKIYMEGYHISDFQNEYGQFILADGIWSGEIGGK